MDDCWHLMWSDTFRNHQVQNMAHTSSQPHTLLLAILGFMSCHDPVNSGFLLPHHPTVKECSVCFFLKWTSHVSWRPKMKPSGLRSVSSASLATEVQSKQHPLLKFSFVPPTSQRGIRKVDFHNRCLESGSGPYLPMLLSPGNLKNKKQKTKTANKHKSNSNKRTNPRP